MTNNAMSSSPFVKLEDEELKIAEINSVKALVAYPSPPPPLIEDRSESLVGLGEVEVCDEVQSLRSQYAKRLHEDTSDGSLDQLELSMYEFAALEERYNTLKVQHSDLRKLSQAFSDVVHGFSSYEDEAVSIEQLRTEAGHEGLRAKALKLDTIRPIIRGAGGLQLMMTQAQSVSSLIEEAGGLEQLRALVDEAYMLRFRLNEVGGLAGIDHLIRQVKSLQSSHRELAELKAQIDKPDGMRAKVQKYSKLQQAFFAIETGTAIDSTQTSQLDAYPLTHAPKTKKSQPVADRTVEMHPARAQLLTKNPIQDPDRDLYEPKPPVTNPLAKTGSNDVPLGMSRGGNGPHDLTTKPSGKRRHDDEQRFSNIAKRPRVDIGCASALVQATLPSSNARAAPLASNAARVPTPLSNSPLDYGEERREMSKCEEPDLKRSIQQTTSVPANTGHLPAHVDGASVDSLLGSAQRYDRSMIKQEDLDDDGSTAAMQKNTSIISSAGQGSAALLVGGYPIAVWIGDKRPNDYNPRDLIRAEHIPASLGKFLVTEITKHLTKTQVETIKTMPANPGTCILRNLLDKTKPSDVPQNHRVCGMCASGSATHSPRPCALLRNVDGVRTVVFVPSLYGMKQNTWGQQQFWVR